jgi:epsilon-lactone hydrolase
MINLVLAVLVLLGIFIAYLLLRPDPLAVYDSPEGQVFPSPCDSPATDSGAFHSSASNSGAPNSGASNSSAQLKLIHAKIRAANSKNNRLSFKQRLLAIRESMDSFFDAVPINSDITPVDVAGVSAEWVIAPGADSRRRLLYIHGGAFYVGSAKSHRVITSKLSEITHAAVLAIDYRLMPEHSRMASVEDCRTAYCWLIDNGPQGTEEASTLFVAGDSAGGNLTLSLLAWLRDTQRRLPNAAVALSPLTDARMRSPSIASNLDSDIILKPMALGLKKIPRPFLVAIKWLFTGRSPVDPVVSPLHGDLSGLPPVLVQVSDSEMLLDDGRRYVNKAVASGSNAVLQRWQHVPHVWQIFYPDLPEAAEAFDKIEAFCKRYS